MSKWAKNNLKDGALSMAVAVAFWFVETWYFGWNLEAQSRAESICDTIAVGLFCYGLGAVVVCSGLMLKIAESPAASKEGGR